MSELDFDELLKNYKRAVDAWVDAIRNEESLATSDHSMVEMEHWDDAGFAVQDAEALVPVVTDTVDRAGSAMAYRESPGAVVGGEITRLLDRGYQKFVKTAKFEFPATAEQLDAIHRFSEELTAVTGGVTLYNESLGTTSDVYEYDRVKGRGAAQPTGVSPWEQAAGH